MIRALTLLAALILTASLATPSSAPDSMVTPSAGGVHPERRALTGAPHGAGSGYAGVGDVRPGGAPSSAAASVQPVAGQPGPTSTPTPLDAITRQGIASHMGDAPVSARYLALPMGPGWRVWLCGPAACDSIVSTDAGPSLAMQRAGRIADLSVPLFERLCGVSRTRGLCPITWTVERRPQVTLPPTDAP